MQNIFLSLRPSPFPTNFHRHFTTKGDSILYLISFPIVIDTNIGVGKFSSVKFFVDIRLRYRGADKETSYSDH